MKQETITLHINKSFRTFKEGEDIILNLIPNAVNYIVGPNGCGKSTFVHFIRAQRHDLYAINKNAFDGMTNNEDKIFKDSTAATILGLDSFDSVFVLDSVDDNPTSFINSATAAGLVEGGGLYAISHSNGQNSKAMISNFIMKMIKVTGFSIEKFRNGERYDKHPLIIVDEVDNGLDAGSQAKFDLMMNNIAQTFNATVICISHNPFTIFANPIGSYIPVYNMEKREMMSIQEYIEEQTGMVINVEWTHKKSEK